MSKSQSSNRLIFIIVFLFCSLVVFRVAAEEFSNNAQLDNGNHINNNNGNGSYNLELESDEYDYYGDVYDEQTIYDPFEKVNRKIFGFNLFLNRTVLTPVAKGYRFVTTEWMRKRIGNLLMNLRSPIVLASSVLQLDFKNSAKTVGSFALNSTVGLVGMFNPAAKMGIYNENRDLGQTLGKYKIGQGPYLVIPIFGPSTIRDGTGTLTERAIDPFGYHNALGVGGERPWVSWEYRTGRWVLYGLDRSNYVYEKLNPIIENSFDPYVLVRNAYLQRRQYEVEK